MPSARSRTACTCLLTAKRNIVKAIEPYGNVYVRLNDRSGGAIDIEVSDPWAYSEAPACDIAAIPSPTLMEVDTLLLPVPALWFVTPEVIGSRHRPRRRSHSDGTLLESHRQVAESPNRAHREHRVDAVGAVGRSQHRRPI